MSPSCWTHRVPAAAVQRTLVASAGDLLESARLFDVYTDAERLGPGVRSLAYALCFRAPDRTLTVDEANLARDAAGRRRDRSARRPAPRLSPPGHV